MCEAPREHGHTTALEARRNRVLLSGAGRVGEHGYSMIWSARSSTACGMVRPRAFAVLRLTISAAAVRGAH